uniref:cysteine dioxygenase n=1 Tax=Oryza sativa subsp. japonica TaxID=39947 RepID=Q7XN34_ORYSJ|nr:OSJNBa0083I11.10 [Oryza sativa Japonica Group]
MALGLSLTLQEWISQNITDWLAFAAADWCFRLHGWPLCRHCWASTSSPTGLPSPPPTGVSACTAGLYAAAVGRLRLHRPACLRRRRLVFPPARLAFMPPLLGVYVFTDRPPRPPPTGASACTAGLLCRLCWASTSSPTGLPSPPPTGGSACTAGLYAAVVGRLRLHRPAASSAADWCFRLHGWPIMPPLLGVYVFTDRLAFAAADWCFRLHGWPLCRRCWASTSSPTGRLVRRRLVLPPARLAFMPPLLGVYVFTDRPPRPPPTGASACTAGLLCRRCWASTSSPTGLPSPPPTGVSACTAGLYAAVVGRLRLHRPAASSAADWCFRLHGWPLCRRCWASTSSPTGRLVRRRLVLPPARLAFMPPLLGVYVFTDWLAFAAADWCFRLHGWPLCRHCWASTSSPTGLPLPPPTGVSACTAGLYAAVVGRLRLHRPACLRRRRLVFPPARLAFMPPLLGVYVFTDRPPRPPPTGASACTAGLLCRRCWASTSSPTGRLVRRRLVLPPARLAYYAAVVGRLRLHRPACLRRRRLVFPPARLAFMPPLLGVYVFTDRLAFAAADWCFRLHGWPLCRRSWASTSSPTGLPSSPPTDVLACTAGLLCRRCWAPTSSPTGLPLSPTTDVLACTAGLYAAVVGRLRLHRPACLRRRRLVFPPARLAFMPPLLGVYVFTDRPPRPPPTGASACTAGLYTAVVGRLRLHRPAASSAADWCHRLHGWPVITPTDAIFFTAGYIAVTTNRHQYLQHKLPTFAMAADWFLHFHGCMILLVLIGLTIFIAGRLVCC